MSPPSCLLRIPNALRHKARIALLVVACFATVISLYLLSLQPLRRPSDSWAFAKLREGSEQELSQCSQLQRGATGDIWNGTETKYQDLSDDKFTIAIQTYKRPDRLNKTLHLYLDKQIPSLEEIVIIWNDVDETPPEDFVSGYNVPVRYRVSSRNSLNEKLKPDPDFRTKAILLSDDDVHYQPTDLDFVFQTWKRHGMNRLTGAFARCTTKNPKTGQWGYSLCNKDSVSYSMVLTGLTFVHISFLDYYHSDVPLMAKIREYVDAEFNCEDIAMNFVTSMLTCKGPLQVSGMKRPTNEMPKKGISTKPGHLQSRSKCVNDFVEMFGHMPLLETTEYIARGLIRG
ncbi:glycosyl transferase family 64 domain-containing protein [Mariannaea sp. PMI_226]|nr:glycosyl transferase family 64 domain-containing protein [Mariannaea sp. PMI_226]